jgi:hypothetical protein
MNIGLGLPFFLVQPLYKVAIVDVIFEFSKGLLSLNLGILCYKNIDHLLDIHRRKCEHY